MDFLRRYLELACLACAGVGLASGPADGAAGQCRWEGGPGAPTYPACEQDDCLGNGGLAQCSAPELAPASSIGAAGADANVWSYRACLWSHPAESAAWCAANGGTWDGEQCAGLSPALAPGIGTANGDAAIVEATDAYVRHKYAACGATRAGDTGWSLPEGTLYCTQARLEANGVPTREFRDLSYATGGSCQSAVTVTLQRQRTVACSPGTRTRTNAGTGHVECVVLAEECCEESRARSRRGNPVAITRGAKLQLEQDVRALGPGALHFTRLYSSQGFHEPGGGMPRPAGVTDYWRHSWEHRLTPMATGDVLAIIRRADGSLQHFDGQGFEMLDQGSGRGRLTGSAGAGWTLDRGTGEQEQYDPQGRLVGVVSPAGLHSRLVYDAAGRLAEVTDHFGRRLRLDYDAAGLLAGVTDPAGQRIAYVRGARGEYLSVVWPDGTSREYLYEDSSHPLRLTGLIDEAGQRIATWTYDAQGRVVRTEGAGGVNAYDLEYVSADVGSRTTRVTDPLAHSTTVSFTQRGGVSRYLSSSAPCADCGPDRQHVHDSRGNVVERRDWNQNRSTYAYDSRNLEILRTEGLDRYRRATPATRTIATEWHSVLPSPVRVVGPSAISTVDRVTEYTYDAAGNELTRTVTAADQVRRWIRSYDSLGRLVTEDGPRTDVADVTRYTYYDALDPCLGCRGRLRSVTNAVGHVIRFDAYDPLGRLLQLTQPTGLTLLFGYDVRGRVTAVTEDAGSAGQRRTGMDYRPDGRLVAIHQPDETVTRFEYDTAGRLNAVTDGLGNRLERYHDAWGNLLAQLSMDDLGQPGWRSLQTRDAANHPDRIAIGGREWDLEVDAAGNLLAEREPGMAVNGAETRHEYDERNRRVLTVDALGGETRYKWSADDRLLSVTAPNGAETRFDYDGLGNLVREISPDRGVTLYGHDAAGNVICRADARAQAHLHESCDAVPGRWSYRYDPLNRLIAIDFPQTPHQPDVQLLYDLYPEHAGRLSQVSYQDDEYRVANDLLWYDPFGQLEARLSNVVSGYTEVRNFVSRFGYSDSGRLERVTYPSGRIVEYRRDAAGRVRAIDMRAHGQLPATTLVAAAGYEPFGPAARIAYGSGLELSLERDNGHRPVAWRLDDLDGGDVVASVSYTLDAAGRITRATDQLEPARSRDFAYDPLGRLTHDSAVNPSASAAYVYDANGNRLQRNGVEPGFPAQVLGYAAGSNRLTSHDGELVYVEPGGTSVYNPVTGATAYTGLNGRPALLANDQAVVYTQYNGLGELVRVQVEPFTSSYRDEFLQFFPDGRPMSQWRQVDHGNIVRVDWIWLGDLPVAQVEEEYQADGNTHVETRLTYLHPDHLGVPRVGTDEQGGVVWRWQPDAFGAGGAAVSGSREVRLRFPGQLDLRAGTWYYNYFRLYDWALGRYLETDPLGIAMGLNTYGYALANPLTYSDPYGLFSLDDLLDDRRMRELMRDPKVRGPLAYVAAGLAEHAADEFCDPALRGLANLAAAGFSFAGGLQFMALSAGTFAVAATAATTGIGVPAAAGAVAVGTGAAVLVGLEAAEAARYLQRAVNTFNAQAPCADEGGC